MRGGGKGGGTAPAVTLDIEPGEDPFGIEPAMRQLVLPAVRFLHDRYWRVEVSGAHHLPASGPALLLANHSGAIPFDGAMIVTAVELQRARTLRFLYDRFVENMGPVATFYRKVGGAVASRENALALLQAGELVLLFPEGVPGVAKTFADRYRLPVPDFSTLFRLGLGAPGGCRIENASDRMPRSTSRQVTGAATGNPGRARGE